MLRMRFVAAAGLLIEQLEALLLGCFLQVVDHQPTRNACRHDHFPRTNPGRGYPDRHQ